MKSLLHYLLLMLLIGCLSLSGCVSVQQSLLDNSNLQRAEETLDSLYKNYSVEGTSLLRENFPFDSKYVPTYLTSEEQAGIPNSYSYLWPYSGTFSAVNALLAASHNPKYKQLLERRVLKGLNEYFDTKREPSAYSSYIQNAPKSDRFYDDNIWVGLNFIELYQLTQEQHYLVKAEQLWKFIESGMDNKLGGGIYWCEQKKESKHACSNAPGAVLALKLFEETKDSAYFHEGKTLYEWTQRNLQDSTDALYFDNIDLDGKIGKAKYAYNSGQMMQSASLLYKLTQNSVYLRDAQKIAQSCYRYFFTDFKPNSGTSFKMIKKGDIWFTAVMLRGFIELYQIDRDKTYIEAFNKSLSYGWKHARDKQGLFHSDMSGTNKDEKKWLLTQAAIVEMYSRLAIILHHSNELQKMQ